ncbi:hypothetical protein JB92DRAFT_2917218, partial [Gautieria morchelliformis]
MRTLVLLLVVQLYGPPLAKGSDRNEYFRTQPPTHKHRNSRSLSRRQSSRSAQRSITRPVSNLSSLVRCSAVRYKVFIRRRTVNVHVALGSNETRRQRRIAGDLIPGVKLQHCGVCGRGGGPCRALHIFGDTA